MSWSLAFNGSSVDAGNGAAILSPSLRSQLAPVRTR